MSFYDDIDALKVHRLVMPLIAAYTSSIICIHNTKIVTIQFGPSKINLFPLENFKYIKPIWSRVL